MRKSFLLLLAAALPLLTIAASAQSKKKPAEATISVSKGVRESELNEVVDVLKSQFAMPSSVTDARLDAAALEGIIRSLTPGIEIFDRKPPADTPPAPGKARREELPGEISYIYMGDFTPDSIKMLEEIMGKLPATTKGVIVDARFSSGRDFKTAAEAASFFVGPGRELFKLQNAQNVVTRTYVTAQNPRSNLDIPLMILVNGATGGAAEAFAHSLKEQNRALLIGSPTSGRAAVFSNVALKSGRWLQIATEMAVSARGAPIFPKGLKPDIEIAPDPDTEDMILTQAAEKNNIAEWTVEADTRKRLTEASLVRNENPEIDNMIEAATSKKDPKASDATGLPPRDRALQRAMDVIKGIQTLGNAMGRPAAPQK